MITIGSLSMQSYSLPNRLGGSSSSQGEQSSGSSMPHTSTAGVVSGDVAAIKLSAALWNLESSTDTSARDEEVWVDAGPSGSKAEREFSELADMDLADMIRAQYLEEHEVTEEELARMPAEEREAIEAEIREATLRALGGNTTADGQTATGQAAANP